MCRVGIPFATKITMNEAAKPTRLARSLTGRPRRTLQFAWTHERSHSLGVPVDSDWAGEALI